MLVPARAVIFVETLNKIPSASSKRESGGIDFYNCKKYNQFFWQCYKKIDDVEKLAATQH